MANNVTDAQMIDAIKSRLNQTVVDNWVIDYRSNILAIRNKLGVTADIPRRSSIEGISRIVIHHSLTKPSVKVDADSFATYHMQTNGWPTIAYYAVVEEDGIIRICNNLRSKTYHCGKFNNRSIGICLVGNFNHIKDVPFDQLESAISLTEVIEDVLDINDVLGHSELDGYHLKHCPGFSMDDYRSMLHTNL